MPILKRRKFTLGTTRVLIEPNWRSRPYPYWFNRCYSDGSRRICIPFLTIDTNQKPLRTKVSNLHA